MSSLSLLAQAPVLNIQLLLDGLFIGAIFVLAAYGLALVWGVMNVKNLAQGDFVIMGGYIAWVLSIDLPIWFGIPEGFSGCRCLKSRFSSSSSQVSTRSSVFLLPLS